MTFSYELMPFSCCNAINCRLQPSHDNFREDIDLDQAKNAWLPESPGLKKKGRNPKDRGPSLGRKRQSHGRKRTSPLPENDGELGSPDGQCESSRLNGKKTVSNSTIEQEKGSSRADPR
ncbi:hypothetical protein IAI18_12185 [Acetobacteraceae bacterium H6797]|nr:hypothetical protein [Acetobacteraceae bacterium H6797]